VIGAQAKLIPQWMALGFIHGVMNTDNTAISGETIDYGPCAFMETFHPQCVFSSIDRNARYAWSNQPDIGLWNLNRFAATLLSLISEDSDVALAKAQKSLDAYTGLFRTEYDHRFRAKFGLAEDGPLDIVRSGLALLSEQNVDFTLFFRHLTSGNRSELSALVKETASLDAWYASWETATLSTPDRTAMRKANPILIPRNHRVEQAIQAAYENDYAPFNQLVDALAKPYEDRATYAAYEQPPKPHEIVHQTFCGT
jgi:uncharacterized protein YdiU (UPF0061 family)